MSLSFSKRLSHQVIHSLKWLSRKIFVFFIDRQVAWDNLTILEKSLNFSSIGKLPRQFDHFKESLYFSPTERSFGTIWLFHKNLWIFHRQAGRLRQFDHFRKSFEFFINGQVTWGSLTTLEKSLNVFIDGQVT